MEKTNLINSQKYSLLGCSSASTDSHEDSSDTESVHGQSCRICNHQSPQRRRGTFVLALLWLIGAIFLLASAVMRMQHRPLESQLVYSPAQGVLRYETKEFTNGFGEKTEFQGPPSPSVDHAWKQSYSFLNRIPKGEAEHLDTPTAEIADDPGQYVVTVEVFHSLHCLDELRKMIWPLYYGTVEERYNVSHEMAAMHQDHCVEALREALMCGSDITPHSWQYVTGTNHVTAAGVGKHSCRDFNAIKQWAVENSMKVDWAPVGLEGQFQDNRWKAGLSSDPKR
ncbi:hypothetical protein F5Y18DRAFT_428781 [Xylariaceae sp. FL1019]|nr:hypothetical protein F5Y18DRAFT_428781 [Xylariaceae sp. FL1019]